MLRPRRIGLFGGAFDPVHNAHLALARAALEALGLDEVRWIPTGHAWHKEHVLTPAHHRAAMVRAAIAGEPRFVLDRRELRRTGPTYTIDTVRELQAAHRGAEITLLIGSDQYAALHTWRGWRELLARVTLAVAARPGVPPPAHAAVQAVAHRAVPLPLSAVSSSDIRMRLASGLPVDDMVPPEVASYIARHRLYREGTTRPDDHAGRTPRMDIRKLQRAIVDGLEDVKAQNIAVFNTEHLSPLFERVIIASGTSNRQTKALASSVRETVKSRGMAVLRTEGEDNGEWIIVDCGAAVAHIMQPAIRDYYHLEEIWGGKAVRMKLGADGHGAALPKASEPAPPPAAKRASAKKPEAKKLGAKPAAKKPGAKKPAAKKARAGKAASHAATAKKSSPAKTRPPAKAAKPATKAPARPKRAPRPAAKQATTRKAVARKTAARRA